MVLQWRVEISTDLVRLCLSRTAELRLIEEWGTRQNVDAVGVLLIDRLEKLFLGLRSVSPLNSIILTGRRLARFSQPHFYVWWSIA